MSRRSSAKLVVLAHASALWIAGCTAALLACGSRSGLDGSDPDSVQFGVAPPTIVDQRLEVPPPPLPILDPPAEMSGCVDFVRSYTSVPSTVMLLIDQSGSMSFRFGQSSRWDVLRQAIVAPDTGLLAWLEPSASVGLMFYTSIDGDLSGLGCPLLGSITPAFGSAANLREAYLRTAPLETGDTPTAAGIDAAVTNLSALVDDTRKYILLVTDGEPDTCAQPDPQNGLDDAIAAAQNAFARGITVRTVGLSSDVRRNGLQAMANAGAGKPRNLRYGVDEGAEPPLSASTEPSELADQLKGVIGDVRTCTVELGTRVDPERVLSNSLVLDGIALEFGGADGWSFADDDTLEVRGAACEQILADGEQLQVTFPCNALAPR